MVESYTLLQKEQCHVFQKHLEILLTDLTRALTPLIINDLTAAQNFSAILLAIEISLN